MDYYYITYHIDIEALHPNRLLELLNSYRLDILTKYKQLTDIYYSIEDGILFQVTKPFVKKWPRRVSSVMSLSKT